MNHLKFIIDDIFNQFSPGLLFWGIASSFLGSLLFAFYKNKPNLRKSLPSQKFLSSLETGGFIISGISLALFIIIHILRFDYLIHGVFLENILSVNGLTMLFLGGYGSFLSIHIIHNLGRILKERHYWHYFLTGLSLMIFIPATFIMMVLVFKVILELWSGMNSEKIDIANEIFRPYLIYLFLAGFFSTCCLIVLEIIKLIFPVFRKLR